MREIKFRGKSIADGKWVYGLPQQLIEIHGMVNLNKQAEIGYIVSYEPERMLQSHAPDNGLYWYEIDNKTLGQFIGVLDKNGKEVYEGDHCITEHGPGWIVYDSTKMAWIIQGFDYWEYVYEELDMQSRMVIVEKPK
jgi:uncharacterized phage protein (TIGR01671 family)